MVVLCCDFMRNIIKDSPPVFDLLAKWAAENPKRVRLCPVIEPIFFSVGERVFSSTWSPDIPPKLQLIIRLFQQVIPYFESMDDLEPRTFTFEIDYLVLLMHRLYFLSYGPTNALAYNTIRLSVVIYVCRGSNLGT